MLRLKLTRGNFNLMVVNNLYWSSGPGFRGSVGIKYPCFFGGVFLAISKKNKGTGQAVGGGCFVLQHLCKGLRTRNERGGGGDTR